LIGGSWPASVREPPRILSFASLDSTNAEARRLAEAGERGPVWITAEEQTAGRGRRGRAWSTGRGNLAATCLFACERPPAEAAQIAFVAAVAVADAFDAFVPPSLVSIKWPNDVLIDARKAAGILVESGPHAGGGLWVAVGCGLNLVHAPSDVERPATTVAEHLAGAVTAPPVPSAALGTLAEAFARRLDIWNLYGFEPIADAWTRRAVGLNRPCVARLDQETIEGVAEGLDPDGALRLRTASGIVRRITAGDVFPVGA
jgi:BirA family biotin operon repressor/biotin-[acetyl-CoA-carboxylase] ligase